jgi:(1->4)-alpha-D-glucan 1-alpha-D-glucosylmutase
VEGEYAKHIIAFARQHGPDWNVIVAPLHTAQLCRQQGTDIRSLDWKNTQVVLPDNAPATWTNQLTGEKGNGKKVSIQTLLDKLPVALLQ